MSEVWLWVKCTLIIIGFVVLIAWGLRENAQNRSECEASGGHWELHGVVGKGGHWECEQESR